EDGDEAHPALDEAAGDEAAGAEVVGLLLADAIHLLRRLALLGEVEGLLRRDLHARGEFEALDARLQFGLAGAFGEMPAVETVDEIEIAFLRIAFQRHGRIEVEDARLLRPDHGALVERGEPAV